MPAPHLPWCRGCERADTETVASKRFAFTLPLLPALGVLGGLMVLPLLMGLGARSAVRGELAQLRTDNASLRAANDSYREATLQLSTQIAALQKAVDEIGDQASLDPEVSRAMSRLPAAVRSRAMGGSATLP